ncbi:unnamed protein product [Symbiodinium pilosum]|uniref:Uncharacterized protein n=1 Tax=Symbiodinium pilosum TaxID=2952 RepID=A0A812P5Z4_SYMPI|nr:unnamed protein product [Symbiodinium pilosum]
MALNSRPSGRSRPAVQRLSNMNFMCQGHLSHIGLLLALFLVITSSQMEQDRLQILHATRAERRIMIQNEVLEYIEIDLHFSAPVYAISCSQLRGLHVAEADRCASCPPGCTLSAAFSRYPYVPELLPKLQSEPECICGISFEEMQLKVQAWPGDQGFNVLTDRRPAFIHGVRDTPLMYTSAIWKFDALMASIKCPNEANMTPALARIRRFGINGPPLDNSLLWFQRFETAFGVESIDRLLANASKSYSARRAVFLLPVRRTKNGRTKQLGLSLQELAPCRLDLPYLVGPRGEPAESVESVGALPERKFPCNPDSLEAAHRQMKAVMDQVLTAGRQHGHCVSDWRTTFPPRGSGGPGGTSGRGYVWGDQGQANETYSPYTTTELSTRHRRVGVLAYRNDFLSPTPEMAMPCSVYRWQLRLRSHNMRERAVSYTAMDAVNGCWSMMERSLRFESRSVVLESQSCTKDPEDENFVFDPCCNLQRLRWQCCAKQTKTIQQSVLMSVDYNAMAGCRKDESGRASFPKAAISAAMAWKRRLTEPLGLQLSWMKLALHEQANAAMWRSVEQCHADVMGRFDRESGMYLGSPCLIDSDCFTRCRKPVLESLQVRVALSQGSRVKTLVLGRCTVPSESRHVYIVRCLARRLGKEVVELLAAQLGLEVPNRNEATIATALASDRSRMTSVCVGPLATPGRAVSREECLSSEGCNWHHEIRTAAECTAEQFQNDEFCGCLEGSCPQQSRRAGCITGAKYTDYCTDAREMLRPLELACASIATSAVELRRCRNLADVHSYMFRHCISSPCTPRAAYFWADEKCNDNMRREFQGCYDSCVMPSGPNPSINREVCFHELWPNETDQDCYRKPGDATVHYSPPLGAENVDENWAGALTVDLPKERRPRYCSIRLWQELEQSKPPRSLASERAALLNRVSRESSENAARLRRTEGQRRENEVFSTAEPPRFTGCDMGPLSLTAESSIACRAKTEFTCCFMPANLTTGACEFCTQANTTSCSIGEKLLAIWAPNLQLYPAFLAEDLGSDLARVDWEDGDIYYRQVPWAWLRSGSGGGCHPVGEGCAAHSQCPVGQYCFSCETCALAYGGNPPPGLCDPCPTHRGGGCGRLDACVRLQDSIDNNCPTEGLIECPCKEEWSVRYQYPGAPSEESINDCYFDVSSNSRWCEVDETYVGSGCNLQRIVGKDRFIYWQTCRPKTCDFCNCDCSENCRAFDVLPAYGRLPAEVVPGVLDAPLSDSMKRFSGIVAPNCTQGSSARIRDVCEYCVACCNDFCNAKAKNEEGGFDCTTTEVSGCSDMVHGWVDSVGRNCPTYVVDSLCTQQGLYGTNWVYNPPRTFADFSSSGLAATDVCCDCGGGVDCSDNPFDWVDSDGHPCTTYETFKWCNRTGYGPGWDLTWGPFKLGTSGVDAHTACCICGGGQALVVPEVINNLVNNEATCRAVWPGRSQWAPPPWFQRNIHLCQLTSNICGRKLQATMYDPATASNMADDERIFGLCLQRAYDTGTLPYLEDFEMSLAPIGTGRRLQGPAYHVSGRTRLNSTGLQHLADYASRRLAILDRNQKMEPTELTRQLIREGASIRVDFFGNRGLGMCYYRMPDPREMFGGANRDVYPPPLLPSRTAETDVFERPRLQALGWPQSFWSALFEDGDAESAIFKVQWPQTFNTATDFSTVLRGLLAKHSVQLVLKGEFDNRVQSWTATLATLECKGPEDDLTKFNQPTEWRPAILHDRTSCRVDRCDVDEMILDDLMCRLTYGCTASCTFCASPSLATQDNGLCVSSDVANCNSLGGVIVAGELFDERMGVKRFQRLCALRHRPMIYCMGPGFSLKRCENFDEASCEEDPLARLMGCYASVRPCQTADHCQMSGHCSDADIGLNLASPGTCVITPLDDNLLQQGCSIGGASSFPDGLCFFRLDPAFGMEVRRRHGLMDLSNLTSDVGTELEDAAAWAASLQEARLASETTDTDILRTRLRDAGKLNQSECEALNPLAPPFQAVWIERSVSPTACARWKACCLLQRGDRCELFTNNAVDADANPDLAREKQTECSQCGGQWVEVFRWTAGVWKRGDLQSPQRGWYSRRWGSINRWVEVVDIDILRRLFENALEERLGQQRLNAAVSMVEPLMTSLKLFAAACGDGSDVMDSSVKRAEMLEDKLAAAATLQLPSGAFELGQILSTSGLISSGSVGDVQLSWHEYSASRFGEASGPAVTYDLSLVPFEYMLGAAAPQIALPGRSSLVRNYLLEYLIVQDTTTTLSPASMETIDAGGIRGGYPAWIINEMIKLDIDVEAEAEAAAELAEKLAATEETRRQERLRAQEAAAKAADAASGLPSPSLYVLTGEYLENNTDMTNSGSSFDLATFDCRNVVANAQGEVFGQIIGDCVQVRSSQTIENSVELCLPLSFGTPEDIQAFNSTAQAEEAGMRFDFAVSQIVPDTYAIDLPPPLQSGTEVPGRLGTVMWNWQDSPAYGRLVPGSFHLTPANLAAEIRRDGAAGARLCSRIYSADTYCPILRLGTHFRAPIWTNATGQPRVGGFDSGCLEFDGLLAEIHRRQMPHMTSPVPYLPLEQQVAEQKVLEGRSQGVLLSVTPTSNLPVCLPGQCLMQRGNGLEVMSADASEGRCAIIC